MRTNKIPKQTGSYDPSKLRNYDAARGDNMRKSEEIHARQVVLQLRRSSRASSLKATCEHFTRLVRRVEHRVVRPHEQAEGAAQKYDERNKRRGNTKGHSICTSITILEQAMFRVLQWNIDDLVWRGGELRLLNADTDQTRNVWGMELRAGIVM